MQQQVSIHRMPVRTWSWLGVNDAEARLPEPSPLLAQSRPEGLSPNIIWREKADPRSLKFDPAARFAGPAGEWLDQNASRRIEIEIPADHREEAPIVLDFELGGAASALTDDVYIEAKQGSSATVVVRYSSPPGSFAQHCGRTRVVARRGATLRLIKVQTLARDAAHLDTVGATVGEGARVEAVLAEMGAEHPVSSCNIVLDGPGASAELDVVYLGDGKRRLDFNHRMEFIGKKTEGLIRARGVLLGESRKIYRDTLDFIRGATGAKGREEEHVLMLSPQVQNLSVPLLLCGEDDVEGEHAASSGRPNERVLFYMASRGIGETDARRMLAEAAFLEAVRRIPVPEMQEEILEALRRSMTGEENA